MLAGELIDWIIDFCLTDQVVFANIEIETEDGERAVKVFHSADAAGVGSNEVNRSGESE